MLLEKRITLSSADFFEGVYYPGQSEQKQSVLDAFSRIQHYCEYYSYSYQFELVAPDKIQLSWFCEPHACVDLFIPEKNKTVVAEKETFTFTGDPEAMKPLIEYVWRLYEFRPSNPAAALGPFPVEHPSWVPALILFENGSGAALSFRDLNILRRFGVLREHLPKLRYPHTRWVDILEASALWFGIRDKTFLEVISDYVVAVFKKTADPKKAKRS